MKTPVIHAAGALLYILTIASIVTNLEGLPEPHPAFGITVFLSLFVFSAAVMGYLFVWHPAALILKGEKQDGIRFFFTTLGFFALFALIIGSTLYFALPAPPPSAFQD